MQIAVETQTPKQISTLGMSREEWKAARRRGIGSSDAAAVLGLNPYRTPLKVYYQKIGEAPEEDERLKMRFGLAIEPEIARVFEEKTGLWVRHDWKIRVDPEYPFLICNLDRTIVASNGEGPGVLEIKLVSASYRKTWEDAVPPIYYIQIQHQMMLTRYSYGYFAMAFVSDWGINEFAQFRVNRDDEFIAHMRQREIDFWLNHVEKRIPPEPMTADDLKLLYPHTQQDKAVEARAETLEIISRLKEIKLQMEPLEEEKKTLEEQLKLAFLDAEILTFNGIPVATYRQTKDMLKFDQKQFEKENPDLYQRYCAIVPGYRRLLLK